MSRRWKCVAAAIVLVASFYSPCYAIINCHDYTYYRLTKRDYSPVGVGRQNGLSAEHLTARLLELGYRIAVTGPKLDSDLKPGDVLLLGSDHSGVVNAGGFIDNWIQLFPEKIGETKPLTGIARKPNELPAGVLQGQKMGGMFINDSLNLFVTRPFSPLSNLGLIKVWRHPNGKIAKNDVWLGYWVPRNPAQVKGKPPMPSLYVYQKDGVFHVQMNKLADLEMTIVKLEPAAMRTTMKAAGDTNNLYTFELQMSPDGPESLTGTWTYANNNGSATFPFDLVLKEQQQVKK